MKPMSTLHLPPMVIWARRVMYGVSCPKLQGLSVFALPSYSCYGLHESHPVTFSCKRVEKAWRAWCAVKLMNARKGMLRVEIIRCCADEPSCRFQMIDNTTFLHLAPWPFTSAVECRRKDMQAIFSSHVQNTCLHISSEKHNNPYRLNARGSSSFTFFKTFCWVRLLGYFFLADERGD